MKKYILAFVALLMYSSSSVAQQDPQYTQYMYNQAVINPAYAGSKDFLSVVALYRNQWTGFDGAPQTMTLSGHSPLGENLGLGLSAIADKNGPVKENNLYADLSYKFNIGNTTKLALGVKAGGTMHDIALNSGVDTAVQGDPFFAQDVSTFTPNVGTGAFLYSDKYYVGLSMPNLLNSVHLNQDGRKLGSETKHFFVTGGYVFDISSNTKFKPSFMVKSSFLDAPISFDINGNFLFFDKFELGASYRHEDSVSGLVGFAFTDYLRLGYAYDHILSEINQVVPASHEIFLQFDLNFAKKVSRSPRFF